MAMSLLERQVRLVEYMTSGAAIFGDNRGLSLTPAIEGIDRGLLQIEAHFSYAKRRDKIIAVFPTTFGLLGRSDAAILRDFVESCPPASISRLENARQFCRFLSSRWMREPSDPPYAPDVAACELACAEVDADVEERRQLERNEPDQRKSGIRRCRAVVLLRCAYDVRPIFETGFEQAVPTKRETRLAVAQPPGANGPLVSEVMPAVFDLLAALDDWVDPSELDAAPAFAKLLADLTAHGLVEARG
jgi:hypothetical protein